MRYEIKVLLDRAVPLEQAGEWQSAIDLCQEAFRRSIEERDVEHLTEAVLRSGFCFRQTGDKDLSIEHLELALILSELVGDRGRMARALNGLGTLYHIHGELANAECHYRRAEQQASAAGNVHIAGQIHQNMGGLAALRGDVEGAAEHFRSALECHREVGHERGIAGILNNLGLLQISARDYAAAETTLGEGLAKAREVGDVITEGIIHLNRTELHIATGDLEAARVACDNAYEIFSRIEEQASRADALRFYGIIYRDAGKHYLAEGHLRQAIEIATTHQYPQEEAEAQRELGFVLRKLNRNVEALAALNRAHELFTSLQATHKQADIDQRVGELENDYLSLVRAWGESIEAKDKYTRGHCQRVADYACRLAEHCGIRPRDLIWFRMGAFLHDVGKTEISAEVLNKPGKLNDDERRLIEQHTVMGDEILAPLNFPWEVRPMVRSHHERWDGRGYPDQLAGENIPFAARILQVADVFDALTSNRSYREPLSPEQAMQIMRDDHGAFDPKVFEVFERVLPSFVSLIPVPEIGGQRA